MKQKKGRKKEKHKYLERFSPLFCQKEKCLSFAGEKQCVVITHYNYEAAPFVVVCSPRVGAAPLNPMAQTSEQNQEHGRRRGR